MSRPPLTREQRAERNALACTRNRGTVARVVREARDDSAEGALPRFRLIECLATLRTSAAKWSSTARDSGSVQRITDARIDEPTKLDAVAAASEALADWIYSNFPRGAQGAWNVRAYDPSGAAIELTFASVELAEFRALADSLLTLIE